jgi:hypothetical protein
MKRRFGENMLPHKTPEGEGRRFSRVVSSESGQHLQLSIISNRPTLTVLRLGALNTFLSMVEALLIDC